MEIFNLVGNVAEGIDLLEGNLTRVSIDTIFRVQRILKEPVLAKAGLKYGGSEKPILKRVENDGKNYLTFEFGKGTSIHHRLLFSLL